MTRHWEPGVPYKTGEILEYQGQRYKVIQGHSSQVSPSQLDTQLFQDLTSIGNDRYCRATGPQDLRPLRCSGT